jgi:hypothetical protein
MTLDRRKDSRYHSGTNGTRDRDTVGIWISRPLHRKVKIEAARRGTDMKTLVEEAIYEHVGESSDRE